MLYLGRENTGVCCVSILIIKHIFKKKKKVDVGMGENYQTSFQQQLSESS